MDFIDLSRMAFSNLWRTKLRSTLTILGVVIGIGALTSMVSLGVGLQKNITNAFKKNDLFTSLTVTSKKIDLQEISEGNIENIGKNLQNTTILNDSVVDVIKNIKNVEVAFPEINIPVKFSIYGKETSLTVIAISSGMRQFYPFNELSKGEFFSNDSAFELILKEKTLRNLGFIFKEDTSKNSDKILLNTDTIIGKRAEIISKSIDFKGIMSNPFMLMMQPKNLPFSDTVIPFVIKGILPDKGDEDFGFDRFRGEVFIPVETSKKIPHLGFNNIWDILNDKSQTNGYGSVYVRVKSVEKTKAVVDTLKARGYHVFALSEELKEIRKAFLIMDSFLGIIGLIALVVASLGIVNTMLMSILERTREIGIMKSIGGSEKEIKTIFFVEASAIGFLGAVFGILLGWVVTRVANFIMKTKIGDDMPDVDLFSFPWWLILGAVSFSILVSLAAGLYPAIRAARVDPVEALRHE